MLKRPIITSIVSVVLTLALAVSSVSVAFAKEAQGVQVVQVANSCGSQIVRTEKLPGGFELQYIVDKNGAEQRVLTLAEKNGNAHRLLFWFVKNDAQLKSLQDALNRGAGKSSNLGAVPASVGFVGGGWISYTSTTMTIFIPHDDAVAMTTGFGIAAAICALIMLLPPAAWAGGVCAFLAGLTAIVINDFDSRGNPGFYVHVRKSPFAIWLSA